MMHIMLKIQEALFMTHNLLFEYMIQFKIYYIVFYHLKLDAFCTRQFEKIQIALKIWFYLCPDQRDCFVVQ